MIKLGVYHSLIFILLGILLHSKLFCQVNTDSLISKLNELSGEDRLSALNLLASATAEENPAKALVYAFEADSLAKIFKNPYDQAYAKRNLGDISYFSDNFEAAINYYSLSHALHMQEGYLIDAADDLYYIALSYDDLNNYNEALLYYKRALKVYDSIGEVDFSPDVLYNIGYLYDVRGEKIKALNYYKRSARISDSLKKYVDMAATLNTIGLLYYSWGDYKTALKYYEQSFSVMEEEGNKSGMAHTLNNLGILYYDWGQEEQALNSYLMSLRLEKEIGNEAGLSASYNNIGIIYADLGEYDQALKYYQNALAIDKKYNDQAGVAACLNNLGELYFELGDKQRAIKTLMQSLAIERNLGIPENLSNAYNTLAELFHKMGEQELALLYNDSSYNLVKPIESPDMLKNNYLLYSQIYESLGSNKEALNYHKKYHALRDSLFSQSALQQISIIQSKHAVDQQEKEIELLNSKNQLQALELENKHMVMQRQKVIIHVAISSFVVLLFFASLFYYQFRQKKKAYSLLDIKNKELLQKRNEIFMAKEKAEESDRIKSSFLANISHELRTPLNGILGFADILQNELPEPMHKEMAEVIHFSGMRLLDTLNSIIDLSIIENNKMELYITRFDLVELIKEKVALFNVIANNKNLEVVQHCQVDKINIHCDPKLLTNTLNNLIDNAVKYTRDGVITIEAGVDDESDRPMVWIKVSDTGIGIPENRLNHIFDRFTQVSEGQTREFEGTGLGLTISKKYIELLQGTISVTSEPGKGSQFLIRLPVSIDVAQLQDNKTSQQTTYSSKEGRENKPKILLVDSNKENQKTLTAQLNQTCDVLEAVDEKTALALAKEYDVDGVFFDLTMESAVNNKATVRQIRKIKKHKETPFAAIINNNTSYPEHNLIKNNGFNYSLYKPFTTIQLKDIIEKMISSTT